MISTFRSFSGGPVSTAYTVVLALLSDMVLVLGNARLEMERELAEGKKQNLGVLVIKAFSSEAAVARFAAGHRLDRWLRRSLQVLRGREYAAVTAQPAPNFSTSIATDLDIAVIDFFIVKSVR